MAKLKETDMSLNPYFAADLLCDLEQFVVFRIQLLRTPWTAARQASLSITNSQSLFKLMSIELVMPSNHLILSSPSPPTLNLSQHLGLFK